jgi:1,4-dihydroxy-2-naphthoate octaprenyltransferase
MANKYYIFAMILIFAWIIGFLIYDLGPYIHILLFIAFIIMLTKIIREEE